MADTPPDWLFPKLEPGKLTFTDREGEKELYFQFNPETFSRSRKVTITETGGNSRLEDKADLQRGQPGRRFSLRADRWRVDSLKLRFDIGKPFFRSQSKQQKAPIKDQVVELTRITRLLEALVEPGPVPSENVANCGHTEQPVPPEITLYFGDKRVWKVLVTSVSIEEESFTPTLLPTRLTATLSIEILQTIPQIESGKSGGQV